MRGGLAGGRGGAWSHCLLLEGVGRIEKVHIIVTFAAHIERLRNDRRWCRCRRRVREVRLCALRVQSLSQKKRAPDSHVPREKSSMQCSRCKQSVQKSSSQRNTALTVAAVGASESRMPCSLMRASSLCITASLKTSEAICSCDSHAAITEVTVPARIAGTAVHKGNTATAQQR